MYGFTKVDWTDRRLASFIKKHDLFHVSANGITHWKKQGCMDLVHIVVLYDNEKTTRDIWVNDTFINQGCCGYICFYKSERYEVYAETQLAARDEALVYFQKKNPRRKIKPWEVSATIAEKANGEPYIHSTMESLQ